jgi:hypothetical protein
VTIAKTTRVNYTTMEDILKGEPVLSGMFSLNRFLLSPYLILVPLMISSGRCRPNDVSWSFDNSIPPYVISTLGGKIVTKQMVIDAPIDLAGRIYKPSLIVLDGQGLDIILGMGWMKAHKALLDTTIEIVHLDSPVHGIHILQLSSSFVATSSVHHIAAQNLEDIPVACEFPIVFPDDLSGMPLDQDVEFTIELQPGTAPISRWPYKMTPQELANLKLQLKELLDKGYIHPSSSPWGCPDP